jgi:hypothetical protein
MSGAFTCVPPRVKRIKRNSHQPKLSPIRRKLNIDMATADQLAHTYSYMSAVAAGQHWASMPHRTPVVPADLCRSDMDACRPAHVDGDRACKLQLDGTREISISCTWLAHCPAGLVGEGEDHAVAPAVSSLDRQECMAWSRPASRASAQLCELLSY